MIGLRRWWKFRSFSWASRTVALLACAGVMWGPSGWAQAAPEGEPFGEVLSEARLEELLDSPPTQPSGGGFLDAMFDPERLAPYFAEGSLARARTEFDRGRYARARLLLEAEEPTYAVRFLKALSAFHARDHATAAEEFAVLADEYLAVRDQCLLRAAQANEKLRRRELAAIQYRAVGPGSILYPEARFGLARMLERQGDVAGALAALEELIASRQAPGPDAIRMKALMATCALSRKRGEYNAEHRALLEVWATSPFSAEAERARQRLVGLPLPLQWKVRRAEALVAVHHHAPALELLDQVLPHVALPEMLACRARLAYGTALRKERQHRKAIPLLAAVARQCDSPELRPQALYLLGYSQSVVEPAAAITTYATLAADYPEHGYADDALFFEAWLLQRIGRADDALARYEAMARRYPAGNFAPEALFRAFWLHFRRSEHEAVLATLRSVEHLPPASRTDEALWRARYWRARILEGQGELDSALAGYVRVATERPATWYGMLARSRLAPLAPEFLVRLQPPPPSSESEGEPGASWPLPLGALGADPHFAAGVELLRMGLPGAVDELLAVDRRLLSEDSARLLFQVLEHAGQRRAAGRVARTSLKQEVRGPLLAETRPIWEATWPLAYRKLIERHARAARVDPDLLQGLIREESRFNPRARSSTGALGLTQLMPATARAVAAALRLPGVTEQMLLQPADNIRLGGAYLGQLLVRFQGNPAHAVAAYNAGPAAVERWRRALPEAEVDEWVEHISFEETREYVKRVLGSYNAYKLLYATESPLLQVSTSRPIESSGVAAPSPRHWRSPGAR